MKSGSEYFNPHRKSRKYLRAVKIIKKTLKILRERNKTIACNHSYYKTEFLLNKETVISVLMRKTNNNITSYRFKGGLKLEKVSESSRKKMTFYQLEKRTKEDFVKEIMIDDRQLKS